MYQWTMNVEPIQTQDRVESVLKEQIQLYKKALSFCNQPQLSKILQDGLIKTQQELIDYRDGRKI